MAAQYKIEPDGSMSITLNIKPIGSFLEQEEQIAAAVAEVGRLASELTMKSYDTDGSPIISSNAKYTSRGLEKKKFQTPWGEIAIDRYTYQGSRGGKLLVPMEERCKIIGGTSTPRFAKMISWKYAQLPASKVSADMAMNHCRPVSRHLIQRLGAAVGDIARANEFEWAYSIPPLPGVVTHVAVGRDGTTTPIVKEGYRETMCGTISLYGAKGVRMHTIYAACAPEYGKNSFDRVMDMELEKVKKLYPTAMYLGLADGAKNNWAYLEERTEVSILDFYHATEHLGEVSVVMCKNEAKRKEWLKNACHDLKHKPKGAAFILRELKAKRAGTKGEIPGVLNENITYFENNLKRMNYHGYQKKGYPIGSGVTEAACKVVAKQRLNGSGMRWTINIAQDTLLLRGLVCTNGRWSQFWDHVVAKRA
jgi:hypothetical protein